MNKIATPPFALPNSMAAAYQLDGGQTCKVILVQTGKDMDQSTLTFNATAYQCDPQTGDFVLDINHEPICSNTTPHTVDVTGIQQGTHRIEDGWVRYPTTQAYAKGSDASTWLIGQESIATGTGVKPTNPWLQGAGAPNSSTTSVTDATGGVGDFYMDTDAMVPYVKVQGVLEQIRQAKVGDLTKLLAAHNTLAGLNLPGLF